MSRDDGFAIADTDTSMLSDPKVLRLARRMRDPIRTAAALVLYDAVRLASWKAGRRLRLDDTVPAWWLEPFDEFADALIECDLLDRERQIPEHAWEGWFGPARDRKARFTELGRRGGLASAQRMVERTLDRTVEPVRPSVIPTVSRAPARGTSQSDFDRRVEATQREIKRVRGEA